MGHINVNITPKVVVQTIERMMYLKFKNWGK